jgi:hypothetical protein
MTRRDGVVSGAWLAAIAAMLIAAAGCSRRDADLAASQREAATGYHLEHLERERLLVVHKPDGEKDDVEIEKLRRVMLLRIAAKDAVDGKARYWWILQGPVGSPHFPFFSAEADAIPAILARELPGFDAQRASGMVSLFRAGKTASCVLWITEDFARELGQRPGSECQP